MSVVMSNNRAGESERGLGAEQGAALPVWDRASYAGPASRWRARRRTGLRPIPRYWAVGAGPSPASASRASTASLSACAPDSGRTKTLNSLIRPSSAKYS